MTSRWQTFRRLQKDGHLRNEFRNKAESEIMVKFWKDIDC